MKSFVKIDSVDVGTVLVADGGFDCLAEGQNCEVLGDKGDPDSHYVVCSHGSHMLDGQIGFHDDDCDQYIGFYLKDI